MTRQINSYFAVLLITVVGAWAAMTIVQIGTSDVLATIVGGSEGSSSSLDLERSILRN